MKAVVSLNISFFFFFVDSFDGILIFGILPKSCTDFSSSLPFRNFVYALSPIGITFSKTWDGFLSSWAPAGRFFMLWFSVLNGFPRCDM